MGFCGILFETRVACEGNPEVGQPLLASLKLWEKKNKNKIP